MLFSTENSLSLSTKAKTSLKTFRHRRASDFNKTKGCDLRILIRPKTIFDVGIGLENQNRLIFYSIGNRIPVLGIFEPEGLQQKGLKGHLG